MISIRHNCMGILLMLAVFSLSLNIILHRLLEESVVYTTESSSGATLPLSEWQRHKSQQDKSVVKLQSDNLKKKRNLSSLPGYYHLFYNQTKRPPKIYLYDTLPEYQECLRRHNKDLQRYRIAYKHGGEVWFIEQIEASPWRTHNPNEADLFILPVFPGFVLYKQVCLEETKRTLSWILKNKTTSDLRNYILLTTHYKAEKTTIEEWCPPCIHLHQENSIDAPKRHSKTKNPHALTVSVPMLSQLYRSVPNSTHQTTALTPQITQRFRNQDIDTFMKTRPTAFFFAGQADNRIAYRGRKQVQQAWEYLNEKDKKRNGHQNNKDNFVFISTNQKENNKKVTLVYNFTNDVSITRFGYQGRGDNPTSSRLYEWIDVGSIPVIVIDDAWLPGLHIPWNDFIIRIPESLGQDEYEKKSKNTNKNVPIHGRGVSTGIQDLADEFYRIAYNISIPRMDEMRKTLQEYAPALLWAAPNSVVTEVMLIDAWEVYLKTKDQSKRKS